MGSWLGHAAPGSFFIIFSVWQLVRVLHTYYSKSGHYSRTKICSAGCCKTGCASRAPLDQWFLIAATCSGVFMEIVTGAENPGGVGMHNWQHVSMYTAFGLSGLVSVLVHHKFPFIPKGAELMSLALGFVVEMVLFAFHLHGRKLVDQHIHMLLVYTIAGCIVCTIAELNNSRSVNAAIARCYFSMVQGTWFYQIAFSLYSVTSPDSSGYKLGAMDLDDAENIMVVTLMYSWHFIGCAIVCMLLAGLVYCCSSRTPTAKGQSLLPKTAAKLYSYDSEQPSGSSSTYPLLNTDEEDVH